MHVSNSLRNPSPLTIAGILFFTLLPLYYTSFQYRLRHPYNNDNALPPLLQRPTEADWIQTWLSTEIISPFNQSPLATYCNRTTWHPNLVLNLDNANGGIGNVRGSMLDFVFQAIEVGASIILPGMASRSQKNLADVWASRSDFATFFDEEWFVKVLGEACPEMAIYKPEPDKPLSVTPLDGKWVPRSRRLDEDKANDRKALMQSLDEWLKSHKDFDKDELNLVNVERTLWDVDTRTIGERGLRRNFGSLLKINPGIRRLAAVVVQNMNARYAVGMDIDPREAISSGTYYGAHLRTEADAKNAGWVDGFMNFENQTDAYIREAVKYGLGVVYVASGNETDLRRFKAKAAMHRPPITVTSKLELLPEKELRILDELSWDQQALVDYEVLLRCSVFGGIVKSSFAYNIAITRNQWLEDQGRVTDPWRVQHSENGVAFDDGLSRMLGRDDFHEHRIPRGMWP